MITPASISFGIFMTFTLFGSSFQDPQFGWKHEGFGFAQDVLNFFDHRARLTFSFLMMNSTFSNVKDSRAFDKHDFQLGFKALLTQMLQ